MNVEIRPATRADQADIVDVLHLAFAEGPVAEWLVEDRRARLVAFHAYATTLFRYALSYGQVFVTTDGLGAAVWFRHPSAVPEQKATDLAIMMEVLAPKLGDAAGRFAALDGAMELNRPTGPGSYRELAFVGVHPPYHGRGIGTALIEYHLTEATRSGLDLDDEPTFLIATNARNQALYERLGFAPRGDAFAPADGAPRLQAMWRERQPIPANGA